MAPAPAARPTPPPAPKPPPRPVATQAQPEPDPAPARSPAPTEPSHSPAAGLDPGARIEDIWSRVREVAGHSRRDRTITSWLTLKSVDERRAVVAVSDPSDYRAAASASQRLAELFREAVGAAVDITVEAPEGEAIDDSQITDKHRRALAHPLVEQAKDLFGARVLRVEDAPPSGPPDEPAGEPPKESD